MLFNSFGFAAFFCVLYVVYLMSMRRLAVQNLILLVGSYFFYGCWDWRFLGLILLSTGIDFVCGWALDRRREPPPADLTEAAAPCYRHSPGARRGILVCSVAANLGILGFFKYYDFFAAGCVELLGAIGLPLDPRLLNVILPVGISFYTFQTLSYTIDVYRGKLRAHRSLLQFAVFVAFFPQLVAGPIVRARDFLPQISKPRRLNLDQIYAGGYLILWGLFKKVVIADNLAILVDGVFSADPTPFGGAVLVALYAFAVQIYCDFSGYSDIARGLSKLMGIDIRLNFKLPYFASNPAEFWRRWHISLSTWLRDYLYIPLGGNRKGTRRTCINLMLTMILGGLWHGAAWTFVIWGAYQGLLLMVHKAAMPWIERIAASWTGRLRAVYKWLAIGLFFHLICLGWLAFRAESVDQISRMLGALCTPWLWWIARGAIGIGETDVTTLLIYALPLVLIQLAQYAKDDLDVVLRMPAFARGLVYSLMFYCLVLFGARLDQPFLYFQF